MSIPPGKWIPAAHHLTPEGLNEFRARMKARVERMQRHSEDRELEKLHADGRIRLLTKVAAK